MRHPPFLLDQNKLESANQTIADLQALLARLRKQMTEAGLDPRREVSTVAQW